MNSLELCPGLWATRRGLMSLQAFYHPTKTDKRIQNQQSFVLFFECFCRIGWAWLSLTEVHLFHYQLLSEPSQPLVSALGRNVCRIGWETGGRGTRRVCSLKSITTTRTKKQVAINQNGLLVRKSEGWLFAVEAHKSSNAGRLALAVTSCNVDKCWTFRRRVHFCLYFSHL